MANSSKLILSLTLVYITAHCWPYPPKMGDKIKHFVRFGHIPLLIILQIFFIICFAVFVDYDPITAKPHGSGTYKAGKDTKGEEFGTSNEEGADHYSGYPCKCNHLYFLMINENLAVSISNWYSFFVQKHFMTIHTLPTAEILCGKNAREFLICGFLMKS